MITARFSDCKRKGGVLKYRVLIPERKGRTADFLFRKET